MTRTLLLSLALTLGTIPVSVQAQTAATGQGEWSPQDRPQLEVGRAAGPIEVDGVLDDPGWEGAARASGFAENYPDSRARPPVESAVLVTYDERNLYLGFIAHDDPAQIRTRISDRDQMWQDDYFGILLDTYGDASWAYFLFANPSGVQGDSRFAESAGEDDGFDIVFESEGRITADGYVVEMAIPFASLRFPDRPEQTWRATFWRTRPRGSRDTYTWAATTRGEQCFLCQFGTLTGIRGVRSGGALELFPAVTASTTGALRDEDDPDAGFGSYDADGDASLGLRYAFPVGLTAEATINPDFSQVESDVAQVDANTTFALFFPERRPFFQEGSDLFETYFSTVYTRQINDPTVAGKLIGRMGRTTLAYLGARDEHSPILLPFAERSFVDLGGPSVSNILRARRTYGGQNSYVGGLFTDRRFEDGGGSGTNWGVDGMQRILGDWRLEYQLLGSHTVEPDEAGPTANLGEATFDDGEHTAVFDGETYGGFAQYTSLERTGRRWFGDIDYWAVSPTYRSDNGFETRNDFRRISTFQELNFYPRNSWIDQFTVDLWIERNWTWDMGDRKREQIEPTVELSLKGQTFVEVGYSWGRDQFRGIDFDGLRQWFLFARSNASDLVQGGFYTEGGRQISRNSDPPVLGDAYYLELFGTVKPFSRMTVQPSLIYSRLDRVDNGEEVFAGWILRTRNTLSFSRQLFLRLVLQYDDFDEQFNVEPLVTFKLNPFTLFYIGSTQIYRDLGPPRDELTAIERQYFAKFQYLFRL
ncbi:MAG TPA: DUF5916 domain-containing protein [Gemmatimonadota bacterium]|nr:DUF5916 domain-containing protein [Gemmatimonadota bacterium]